MLIRLADRLKDEPLAAFWFQIGVNTWGASEAICSEPKENHMFIIENDEKLQHLKTKICKMEGDGDFVFFF